MSDSSSSISTTVAEAIAATHRIATLLIGLQAAEHLAAPDTDESVAVLNRAVSNFTLIRVPPNGPEKSGPLPASESAIDAMPRWVVGEDNAGDVEDCVICLEECRVGSEIRQMPCQHGFHSGCIEKWLRIHGSCPVCRFLMPAEGERREEEGGGGGEDGRRQRIGLLILGSGSDSDLNSDDDDDVGELDNSGSGQTEPESSGSGGDVELENLELGWEFEVDNA